MYRTLMLAGCLALVLQVAAGAETLVLKDGNPIRGTILGADDHSVTVELFDLPGSRFGIEFDRLTDFSIYDVKVRTLKTDTAEAHLELAQFCEGRQMYHFAVQELRKAAELDPSRAADLQTRIAALQDTCGRMFYEKGQSLLQAGRYAEAIRFFKDVTAKYPGCKFEEKAREGVALAEASHADEKRRAAAEQARAADEAQAAEKATAEAAARQRIFGLLAKGRDLNRSGHAAAKSLGRQEDLFEQAQVLLEKARRLALALAEGPAAAPVKPGETTVIGKAQIVEEVTDTLIETYVNLGFNAIQRGAFEKAFEYAGLALALDPNSESAVNLRSTIATARAAVGR